MLEFQVGEVVRLATQDAYNGMLGIIKWILLPPPWLPEDQWGYEYWVLFTRECYQLTAPFYKHEVRRVEAKEVPPAK